MNYKHFGVMLDCSRNAVMKPESVKKMIDILSVMGYNCLELYTEDTYELPGEPYFGYMRGRYTQEELRDIDAYARSKNMELMPCIQTLAHFTNLVKHAAYADIVDCGDILLCGDEKTYALFDKIFAFLSETFTSRNVNIGMDEAFLVGLGKYLAQHGYQKRYEILLNHLQRICTIAAKYGFHCHMWSDMIFRLKNDGVDDAAIPRNVALTYWDYYHDTEEHYSRRIEEHQALGREVWFAGGAWSWHGFAPLNAYTLKNSLPAMKSVRSHGIENVLITMWGDNGKECSFYSLLPSLYAIRRYADGVYDEAQIKAEFDRLFSLPYDAFMLLDLPNVVKDRPLMSESICKTLLYSDPFMGIADVEAAKMPPIPYHDYADRLAAYKDHAEYGYIFDSMSKLCRVLAHKYDLGIRIRKAYLANDKAGLHMIAADEIPDLIRDLEHFYRAYRHLWYTENKPFGFEIQDVRLGGVMWRLRAVAERILLYVEGGIHKIEELDEAVLPRSPGNTMIGHIPYVNCISAGCI